MNSLQLDRLWEFFDGIPPVVAMLWLGLGLFTIGLAILMYTRWGQYKPLRKCMAMSLLAHLLLAGYGATIEISTPVPPPPEPIIRVSIGEVAEEPASSADGASVAAKGNEQPWDMFRNEAVAPPEKTELERGPTDEPIEPPRLVRSEGRGLPGDPAVDHVAVAEMKPLPAIEAAGPSAPSEAAATLEAPPAERRDARRP